MLETLVVEGDRNTVFVPPGRYAKMRNVWFLPSPAALVHWLERVGFIHIEVVSVVKTDNREQRSTPWMTYHSLDNFLSTEDPTRTVEGHPAPRRALLTARKAC